MDFRTFMQAVEQEIDNFQSESEIKEWLRNYARTIDEESRENFLRQFEKRGRVSHEEELKAVIDWCEKIDEGELTLSCRGHEEYGDFYWDNDWVYEYEDPYRIGDQIKCFYQLAEQCIYDRDYETAGIIYGCMEDLNVLAIDGYGGDDYMELPVEQMVQEEIVTLDLKRIALLTLYTTYQVTEMGKRAQKLYEYFSRVMFREIKLEEMMTVGYEPLEQFDSFMELWIAYLRGQDDVWTSRLLTEAVLYRYGEDGLLEEAKRCANQHPKLFIKMLEKYYEAQAWEKLHQEGKYALSCMDRKMKIRGCAARLAAAGARAVGDEEEVKNACIEAFYSELSAENYFRMIICKGITEAEITEALNYLETVRNTAEGESCGSGRQLRREPQETAAYKVEEREYITIQFLAQNFYAVLEKCNRQKEALGWTGDYISTGVPLLLFLIYKGGVYPPGIQAILGEIQSNIQYKNKYNEPSFEYAVKVWKEQVKLDADMEKAILKYLQKTIDARVEAIVSGGHRGSYNKAARLAAALGEAEESCGILQGKTRRIQKYLAQFPRHRAFKSEMQEYM